jgi:p-hydroxybenzoate 3-monooxygenase
LNVALFDVDTLAQAVMRAVRDGDAAALAGYSTWWWHPWRYQEFSAWMTDSMHDAGGPALNGPLRPDDGARQVRRTV